MNNQKFSLPALLITSCFMKNAFSTGMPQGENLLLKPHPNQKSNLIHADTSSNRFRINDEKPLINFDFSAPQSVPTGNPTIDNSNLRYLKDCVRILGRANCKQN